MTNLRKSDAQLDAEAQRRSDTPLMELVEDHRYLYRAELYVPRLHAGASSGGRSTKGGAAGDMGGLPYTVRPKPRAQSGGQGWTGVPFSGPFEQFIDWDRRHQEAGVRPGHPGSTFPWSKAMFAQWAECRRSHPEHHDRPEWRGSLCYQLVSWTVRHSCSLEAACLILGVTPDRAGRTLRNALLWVESHITQQRQRQEQQRSAQAPRQPAEWTASSEEHRALDGVHAAECPHPVCRARRAA